MVLDEKKGVGTERLGMEGGKILESDLISGG